MKAGINRKTAGNKEISALMDAVLGYFQTVRHVYETKPVIFCSFFPSLDDFNLLLKTKIRTVYYMGDIEDEETVKFLNILTREKPEESFEIINLKFLEKNREKKGTR